MEKVSMFDRELAKLFLVYANFDQEIVNQMFDRVSKKHLFDLVNYFGHSQFQLLIFSQKFIIKKRMDRNLGGKSKELVRMAIRLRDLITKSIEKSDSGFSNSEIDEGNITFLDVRDASAEAIEETECQICGQVLETDLVKCRTCMTLHHKDCWEYNGRCSTFGCLQRRYQVNG